jgi:hypothetical protein
MKFFTIIALIFLTTVQVSTAQAEFNYDQTDAHALRFKKADYKTHLLLAEAICKDLKTDRDKARAIFTWLAHNIKYDIEGMGRDPIRAESLEALENKMDKITANVYKKGKGVCHDYSTLYLEMCEVAKVECLLVGGHARQNNRRGWEGHAWNAVNIEGKWQLLDVTWGAGYIDDDEKFHYDFASGYFATAPHLFILNHFPLDEKWQLLETPIDKKSFKNQPAIGFRHTKWGITDAEPLREPLKKDAQGNVAVRFKIKNPPELILVGLGLKRIMPDRDYKDGWLTLRFSPGIHSKVEIFGGKKAKKTRLYLLGSFSVDR